MEEFDFKKLMGAMGIFVYLALVVYAIAYFSQDNIAGEGIIKAYEGIMLTVTADSVRPTFVYVGAYTQKEGSRGIYVYHFASSSGHLTLASVAEGVENPSFLAVAPNRRFLYAVNELGPDGFVSAFALDPASGALTFLNRQSSRGAAPCHLSVDSAGRYVYAANYNSGTVAVYPIQNDGSLGPASDVVRHTGSGLDPRRQEGPHAHSVTLSPNDRFAFVADLGLDKVLIYDVAAAPGKFTPYGAAGVAGGSGPRHFTFHPNGRFAYLINEMGNTITAFAYDNGALTEIQTAPTLPESFDGQSTAADIHIAPSGKFLYGSNRGHDSLVVYAIDPETGLLSYVEHTPTQGKTPRNFALDPTGAFLVAANQDSNNLMVFSVDAATGSLDWTGKTAAVFMPTCVKFVQP